MSPPDPETMRPSAGWQLASRTAAMNPSAIREILKLTERPGVVSLSGGLPSPATFPVEALREACERVLSDEQSARQALQYAASEGYGPLREAVAAGLCRQGQAVEPSQVLITSGSQQGLDLLGKLLIDAGSPVLVESPTYLGALQAFAPMAPRCIELASDGEGPLPQALREAVAGPAAGARALYLLPNFQNPTGRSLSLPRRQALVDAAETAGVPVIEDNPYGELWYEAPPPASLASLAPGRVAYLGSFSKVLAPGLRLGYVVVPPALYPKLLQAKQAADLHTPIFNQRLVHELLRDGFLDRHVPTIRERYRRHRDAMLAALERHMPVGVRWNRPAGGMFLWLELPAGLDAGVLLPRAVERGVAYVPGAPFFAGAPRANTLRLSFVTVEPEVIGQAVQALAGVLREAIEEGAR